MNDDLMTIGQFARRSGLGIHALRHYDDVDLLTPYEVDAESGYRRYARHQLATARLIIDLRWLDLPLEDVRTVLDDPDGDGAKAVLDTHARRLERMRHHLTRQLESIGRNIEEGLTMPETVHEATPVQIKIAVDDLDSANTFYREAFGFVEQVVRHTDDEDFVGYQFGTYGQPGFLLVHLLAHDGPDFDRPGRATFGLLVDDLDVVHRRAVALGATELLAPKVAQGMPRHSAVRDSSGNCIWLYQG